MNFKDKIVVISGGSSGIGKDLAINLAQKGAHVAICARRQNVLDEALEEIKEYRQNDTQKFLAKSTDISVYNQVDSFIQTVIVEMGIPDVLLNNAGLSICDHIHNIKPDQFKQLVEVDYLGYVYPVLALLPHLKKRKSGYIANISSMAGVIGVYGYSAYSPPKFAVNGFSEVLRYELAKYNITVSLILPPDADTPQYRRENDTKPEATYAIAGTIKLMDSDELAKMIIKAMEKEKYYIIPTLMGKLTFFVNRVFPFIVRWVMQSAIKKAEKGKEY
jgi:3-dehydrosphinganine reductase